MTPRPSRVARAGSNASGIAIPPDPESARNRRRCRRARNEPNSSGEERAMRVARRRSSRARMCRTASSRIAGRHDRDPTADCMLERVDPRFAVDRSHNMPPCPIMSDHSHRAAKGPNTSAPSNLARTPPPHGAGPTVRASGTSRRPHACAIERIGFRLAYIIAVAGSRASREHDPTESRRPFGDAPAPSQALPHNRCYVDNASAKHRLRRTATTGPQR